MWKNLIKKFDRILLPLLFYYDNFETGNLSRASVHKFGGLHYTIVRIPKAHALFLKNIFLGELFYSSNREIFGDKISFKPIIDELINLKNCGITICV